MFVVSFLQLFIQQSVHSMLKQSYIAHIPNCRSKESIKLAEYFCDSLGKMCGMDKQKMDRKEKIMALVKLLATHSTGKQTAYSRQLAQVQKSIAQRLAMPNIEKQ